MQYRKYQRPSAPRFEREYPATQAVSRPPLTLAQLDAAHASFQEHALYVEQKSPATVRHYRDVYLCYRRFLVDPALSGGPEARIGDITGWVTWMQKTNPRLSKITLNTYYRALRPLFRYLAATAGLLDPFLSRRAPKLPKGRAPKALRPADTIRVLNAARDYPWRNAFTRTRAVALVAIMTLGGLRKGEVLRLQVGDVDLPSGRISILDSKADKSRSVYMPPELRLALASYLDARASRRGTAFFLSKNDQPLSNSQFRRIIRMVGAAAGVRLFAHALRHSYITLLLQSRVPLHVVQSLAGHADLETTQRYTAIWDEEKRSAVQRVRLTNRY